ncbi:MAG: M24 family metallopeptidase, partial [Gammaproteobacteria bacterium]
ADVAAGGPRKGDPLPELGFLKDTPLFDAARARFFMEREGLDALVVTHSANVYYLSNHWPQLDRMGFTDSAIAIWPKDPQRPLTLIMHAFSYFYTVSPEAYFEGRLIFPYTNPTGPAETEGAEPPSAPARGLRVLDPELMTAREQHRQQSLAGAKPASADASWALKKALAELGLSKARLGIDDTRLEAVLRSRGVDAEVRPAENTLRRIRMSKSPVEIQLMRLAAQQNVDAAMAAARQARALGSTQALRARFYAEAAARGNSGVFMVINGASSEVIDEPIGDGMAFSIDCVSHCRHYHGDFARTIFVGEPRPQMRRATDAIAVAWQEIREQLRAGMRFDDVSRIGRESIKKQGLDLPVSFRPHSVGLFHTDHPQPSLIEPRKPDELVLEENMILSVDCPVLQAGQGGTAHLEDLMLIGRNGAEPIHDVPPGVIVV